ncbi:MAG: hypothetical protein FJ011_22395, partial [Chloroflexi bacterium]|nr:hypothetical protein [Chloroflexota bacterium]
MTHTDQTILRDLAARYGEVCGRPEMDARRDLWRRHNSLKWTRPLIYTRAFAWKELPESELVCQDPFFRHFENFFRYQLYWDSLGDDSIFEPWVTLHATYRCSGWGVSGARHRTSDEGGSYKVDYPLKTEADIEKLRPPWHEIDEEATARNASRLHDALGDIITINIDRGPAYRMWTGDISTDLGHLRGIENFMLDMSDRPAWLHRLAGFMRDGILRTHAQAEAVGDWSLSAHQNQAMFYAEELPDPAANVNGIKRKQLWGYMAAQEFALVGPKKHDEFLLQYQIPILKEFGLVAYGCCEDLTKKIGILRQIPNLRRIGVSPFADAARCAEQIGTDYVLSYRPSPADMVGYGFDPDRILAILRRDLGACKACHTDITLKDVETVQGDPTRVREWVKLTR